MRNLGLELCIESTAEVQQVITSLVKSKFKCLPSVFSMTRKTLLVIEKLIAIILANYVV